MTFRRGLMAAAATLSIFLRATAASAQSERLSELRDGPVHVLFAERSRLLAERTVAQVRQTHLPAIADSTLLSEPLRIVLAPDARTFSQWAPDAPEWGAGVAYPDEGLIVLPAFDSRRGAAVQLGRVLRHELAHVALRRAVFPAGIPRWFDEGYARWAAGEWDENAGWMLRLAFAMHRAPPLDSLSLDWPAAEADAQIAYLLAMSTVDFLADRGGERALRIFFARWRASGGLEPALRATYGLTLGQFEEDWRAEVRRSYGWALFLSDAVVFWFLGAIALVVLVRIRKRRNALRLRALAERDPPDAPAYWSGEEPLLPQEEAEAEEEP